MRVLTVSDKIVPYLYNESLHTVVGKVDLLLSCGDVPHYYLDYIATSLNVPVYFVYGNHGFEGEITWGGQRTLGRGANLHRRVIRHGPLIIAGLEGSRRYNTRGRFQYTEGEMTGHCLSLIPALLWNRLVHGRYLDVLITHAPPRHIHDAQDLPHRGFRCFRWFMRLFRPRYLIHGHKHVYRRDEQTVTQYYATTVINTYPYAVLDLEPGPQHSVVRALRDLGTVLQQNLHRLWTSWVRPHVESHEEEVLP